jgi:hypothetical protein
MNSVSYLSVYCWASLTSHIFILLLYFTKQEPIKIIHFNSANPVCHAFDSEAKDGHDLLIGLNSGDGDYLHPSNFFSISRSKLTILPVSYILLTELLNVQTSTPFWPLSFACLNDLSIWFYPLACVHLEPSFYKIWHGDCGTVYSASLRQQLQDVGKKLVGALHYNKDGSINGSRCNAVAWVPNAEGLFVAGHADGNAYVYDKSKEGGGDVPFPPVKDTTQFSISHARSSKVILH